MQIGIGLSLTGGRNIYSPASLFAAGEQGGWYDPSDLSSMWQDSAGTTAAIVGLPVGFVGDKRLGMALGASLRASGAVGLIGAATPATYNTTTGAGTVVRVDGTNQSYVTWTGLSSGVTYALNISNTGADVMAVRRGAQSGAVVTSIAAGVTSTVMADTTGVTQLTLTYGSAAGSAAFTVNSFALLPGNHAIQATSASRPTLLSTPLKLDYDAVDDSLVATFPTSLGAACTVARSVPGSGASILTAQTIGTTYTDSTDHCGLVIINRALTAAETTALTNYLNAKAGV